MTLALILPSRRYEQSYRDYIDELGSEERYPFPLDFDCIDFDLLLAQLSDFANSIHLPEGFVPSSTYWLVDGATLIGVSNLRHRLTERLRAIGGHIGMGIRPSCRGRGHGMALMRLTVAEARKRGIDEVHIHCHKHNHASARIIRRIGGVLGDAVRPEGSSLEIERYVLPAT